MTTTSRSPAASPAADAGRSLTARLRHVLHAHFDPIAGTPYWLDRQKSLGIDVRDRVRTVDDLALLGAMSPHALAGRSILDFVPRRLHDTRTEWIIAQTGGATGMPAWTAYGPAEFREAFVTPFARAAEHVGFPRGEAWLYAGPSGPHIIGRAAADIARETGSPPPFCVDFDPRWARKLGEGSFAQRRYLEHIVEQSLDVISTQDIGVMFTTPRVLTNLAPRMSEKQRRRVRGVHYGGMRLDPAELETLQTTWLPGAVHLAGYGNTLFGCCLELDASPGRVPTYFPFGDRLLLSVVDGPGAANHESRRGRVCFTRLDETMLLVNFIERDEAGLTASPSGAPTGFHHAGLRDVGPAADAPSVAAGIY